MFTPARTRESMRLLVRAILLAFSVGCGWQQSSDGNLRAENPVASDLHTIITMLQSPSADDRAAGAQLVGQLGEDGVPAIPILIDMLKDTRPVGDGKSVADAASAALGRMGKPAAEACLAARINDPACEQSETLRLTLGRFRGDDAIKMFITFVKNPDAYIRRTAIQSLEYSEAPQLVPALIEAFQDPGEYGRSIAVQHFIRHADQRAVSPSTDRLRDTSKSVRKVAAEALGTQGDKGAIPAVLARVQDDTEAADVQRHAAESLGKIGGPDAYDTLAAIVAKGPEPTGQRPGAGTAVNYDGKRVSSDRCGARFGAIQGLGHLGDRRASEMLRSILRNRDEDGPLRTVAGSSLRRIEGAEVIPLMMEIVTAPSEDPIVQSCLATGLVRASDGVIDDVRVVTALSDWKHISYPITQETSIEVTIPALEAVANRGATPEVRAAAKGQLAEAKQQLRQLRGE